MMDYAKLTLPHDSLGGLSPFEVTRGYAPRTSWDWHNPKPIEPQHKLSNEAAKAMCQRVHAAWKKARECMQDAQQKKKTAADHNRREINFKPGGYVYVDLRHLPCDRPCRKLDNPLKGPYKILEQKGHAFKLDLPASMEIHPNFSPDKLHLAHENPLTGQWNPPEPPINITGEDDWEVQEVLASKIRRGNILQYRVKWLGYDENLTWYDAEDLMPHNIRDFHLANPDQRGPPRRMLEWLKAWEDGLDDYDELIDSKVMDKRSRASLFAREG
jgi:hypothetical protein